MNVHTYEPDSCFFSPVMAIEPEFGKRQTKGKIPYLYRDLSLYSVQSLIHSVNGRMCLNTCLACRMSAHAVRSSAQHWSHLQALPPKTFHHLLLNSKHMNKPLFLLSNFVLYIPHLFLLVVYCFHMDRVID